MSALACRVDERGIKIVLVEKKRGGSDGPAYQREITARLSADEAQALGFDLIAAASTQKEALSA